MGWFSDNPSNVSSGGQVYDRTTGSWAGETQGSAGDGVDRSRAASEVKIWRDANGIVGYDEKTDKTITRTPAQKAWDAEQAANRAAAAKAAAATKGPGAPAAGKPAGTGAGVGGVTTGGGTTGPGAAVVVTGPLAPKLKKTHTQLHLGGTGWIHNSRWSDTAEWEERYGEPGDWLGGIVTMGVDVGANARRVWDDAMAVPKQEQFQPGGGQWLTEEVGHWWNEANSPWGPDKPIAGYGSGGF